MTWKSFRETPKSEFIKVCSNMMGDKATGAATYHRVLKQQNGTIYLMNEKYHKKKRRKKIIIINITFTEYFN